MSFEEDFNRIFEAAEIANNKLYVLDRNYKGDKWVPIDQAQRVGTGIKQDYKNVYNSLSDQDLVKLNDFQPNPTPDIQIPGSGDRAIVNFPNGQKKTITLESKEKKENIMRESILPDEITIEVAEMLEEDPEFIMADDDDKRRMIKFALWDELGPIVKSNQNDMENMIDNVLEIINM